MEGFFSAKETQSLSRLDGKSYTCISCGLYKSCQSPRMVAYGNFRKKILNIGEAPGETEDERGKPWQGKMGRLLQKTYRELGIDLFEDCLNINAVNCKPKENRTPTNYEIECCRQRVIQLITEQKPHLIIALGNSAIYSLLAHRWKRDLGTITKWRGWQIPDQDFGAWICPTFHPSYIERQDAQDVNTIWKADLSNAIACLSMPFPKYKKPNVRIIDDLYMLTNIKSDEIAFDYETTGLKPHALGHRIICCAIATSEDACYAFMMPATRRERQPFIDLLIDKRIGKIAQNMKFEHTWSLVRLNTEVQNWVWDTMLASHILDNRPGVTSLKFQTYVQFGVVDYASEISPYLQATDNTNANAMNKIEDLLSITGGRHKLLTYCGLDAVHEYRLAMKQRADIVLPF